MIKVKMYDLSVSGVVFRFYFMMGVAIALGELALWTLAAVLALFLAVSMILGVSIKVVPKTSKVTTKDRATTGRERAVLPASREVLQPIA